MYARLTDEQAQVQDSATAFLESNGGIEYARRLMEGEAGVVDELWADIAAQGFPAATVPEDHGGLGNGMVGLCALLEATGRFAMPGPFPETAAVATPLIAELGTEAQRERYLPAIADGDRRLSLALAGGCEASLPDAITLEGTVREAGGIELSGRTVLVPYAGDVDDLVVAARTQSGTGFEGITLCLVDPDSAGVEYEQRQSLDRTRPLYTVSFEEHGVDESRVLGPVHDGGAALARGLDRYRLACAAMMLGGAARSVDRSVDHATTREQYGQPVGKFQAVKHRIADMWMTVENARSLTYYAAWALDADRPDAPGAVSACWVYGADRLHGVFEDDIRTHGGTGFTWGHDAHIHLKQAKAWRTLLGDPEDQADRLLNSGLY